MKMLVYVSLIQAYSTFLSMTLPQVYSFLLVTIAKRPRIVHQHGQRPTIHSKLERKGAIDDKVECLSQKA